MRFYLLLIFINLFIIPSYHQIVRKNFKARNRFEVSLKKGETVTCVKEYDANFSIVAVGNRCGFSPKIYIDVSFKFNNDNKIEKYF